MMTRRFDNKAMTALAAGDGMTGMGHALLYHDEGEGLRDFRGPTPSTPIPDAADTQKSCCSHIGKEALELADRDPTERCMTECGEMRNRMSFLRRDRYSWRIALLLEEIHSIAIPRGRRTMPKTCRIWTVCSMSPRVHQMEPLLTQCGRSSERRAR